MSRIDSTKVGLGLDAVQITTARNGVGLSALLILVLIGLISPRVALASAQQDCRRDPTTGEWRCRDVGNPEPPPDDATNLGKVTVHGSSWIDLYNRWQYDALYRRQTGPESPPDRIGGGGAAAEPSAKTDTLCKNAGKLAAGTLAIGNPILPATGEKVESVTDFITNGEVPLYLTRTYRRYHTAKGLFGYNWSTNFDLRIAKTADGQRITAYRDQAGEIDFVYQSTPVAGWYENVSEPGARIVVDGSGGYILYLQDNSVET